MARTSVSPPLPKAYLSRPSKQTPWVTGLYVLLVISIFMVILYFLKKLIAPLNLQAAINVAKANRFDKHGDDRRCYRPNMETLGLYGHTGEISFTEYCKTQGLYNLRFILRASVDILGRGSLGTTYKVILRDGSIIALKRLAEMSLKQKDFEQHINKLGRLHTQNIVPVQSYYHSKGLTFVIYDYMCLGSLSSLMQGGRECNHTTLDWPTRLSIATDIAHALKCLHSNSIVHGNLKSSNIFLQIDFTPMLAEYGLVQVTSPMLADEATLGYKAPELMDASAPDYMSDVYSFGVLLMELLTGIPPRSFDGCTGAGSSKDSFETSTSLRAADLPEWVAKMSREKDIGDLFDRELKPAAFETTVVQMLHVATACVSTPTDSRPSMSRVVRMMEHIKYIHDNGHYPLPVGRTLYDAMSDAESHSSMAVLLPDDFTCSTLSSTSCLNR
ncbi:hypothetical protein GOP47_0007865 [Adiantum capillus-veneris]|uniref:Protein kinase domain-containing protein n=1 Tax=Adiantum capillus-veneris TaxID=13818 RepID=A0A9D4ZLX7_ADICA|nr:hypothetical protein GOP47_0007865 [Adiantum capillus-veneris]